MTTDPLKDVLPALSNLFHEGGQQALLKDAGLGETFTYAPSFPLTNVRIPLQDIADAVPVGQSPKALLDAFDSVIDSQTLGNASLVRVPEGMSSQELLEAWDQVNLFSDSGALTVRKVQFSKELAKTIIEARGLDDLFLVVDDDFKVIVGLEYFWALSELDEYKSAPVVILHNAPFNAGYQHQLAREEKEQSSFRSNKRFQEELKTASPDEREAFQALGFSYVPDQVTLTCSEDTLDRLGPLIRKQLGNNTKFDPAQMLYVEALREEVLKFRNKLVEDGNTAGDVVPKLARHLKDEKDALERGAKIEAKNGWRWSVDEDGTFSHPALARYRFKVTDAATKPDHSGEAVGSELDLYAMAEDQFRILARYHFGLEAGQAAELRNVESAESFNQRLRRYVENAPEIAPSKQGPSSEEERESQRNRLELWSA